METVTVTVAVPDALVVALGPLDYAVKSTDLGGRTVPAGGSALAVRRALRSALQEAGHWPES